jgi:hypothetical protein
MLSFVTRLPRAPAAPRRRRVPPALEALETRDCPAGPVITSFTATALAGSTVRLSGTVSDDDPSSVSISFGGPIGGMTTAGASGAFSYTAEASASGTETASATDGNALVSDTVQTPVTIATPSRPSLTLNITSAGRNLVVLSGQVRAGSPGGLTVSFSGMLSGSAVTNPDGTYKVTLLATGMGEVQATVTDVAGQTSDPVSAMLPNTPPVIQNFRASWVSGTTWVLSGSVSDESPAGLTVQFGGVGSADGRTATVAADGTFSLTVTLQPGEGGMVSALCTDWFDMQSNIASDSIMAYDSMPS